jgi:hypothetical protein
MVMMNNGSPRGFAGFGTWTMPNISEKGGTPNKYK